MNPGLRLANVGWLGLIRASADFSPPDASNLVFWGRVDDLGGSDNDLISSFTDKSGLGNHATSATTARPTLKTAIVNGHNVLRFDGAGDHLLWGDIFAAASAGTAIVVLKAANEPAGAGKHNLWYMAKTSGVAEPSHPFTDGTVKDHFGSDLCSDAIAKPSAANVFHVYSVNTASNKMLLRWNGEIFWGLNKITPGFNSAPKFAENAGATTSWEGDLAEIFLYKSVLSSANLKRVYDYLAARYSISVTDVTTTYSPSDFSGLQTWFKADQIPSLNDGDPVSTWSDQSGNANNATASLTLRPLYKTNIFNGLPAVRFDGSNDSLILGSNQALTGALTCLFIGQATVDNGALFGNATSGSQIRVRRAGVNDMNFFTGGSELTSGTGWRYGLGALNLFACTRDGSNNVRWYQGPEIKGSSTGTGTFNNAYVGTPVTAGLIFGGDVGEVCVWNTALSPASIAKLYYTYFRDKWGLP